MKNAYLISTWNTDEPKCIIIAENREDAVTYYYETRLSSKSRNSRIQCRELTSDQYNWWKTAKGLHTYEVPDEAPALKDVTDLIILQRVRFGSDEFEELSEDRLKEVYKYLKLHANWEMCRKNLEQLRYAVTRKHFGY